MGRMSPVAVVPLTEDELAQWESREQLRAREFPDLTAEEIQLAVDYYRAHPDEIEASLRREREIRERHRLAAVG